MVIREIIFARILLLFVTSIKLDFRIVTIMTNTDAVAPIRWRLRMLGMQDLEGPASGKLAFCDRPAVGRNTGDSARQIEAYNKLVVQEGMTSEKSLKFTQRQAADRDIRTLRPNSPVSADISVSIDPAKDSFSLIIGKVIIVNKHIVPALPVCCRTNLRDDEQPHIVKKLIRIAQRDKAIRAFSPVKGKLL